NHGFVIADQSGTTSVPLWLSSSEVSTASQRPKLTVMLAGSTTIDAGTSDMSCVPTTCAAQGKNCGSISDHCGGTLSCGSCSSPETCGGGGTSNVCGGGTAIDAGTSDLTCVPSTCASKGKNCGSISDGCGGTLSCGSCSSPETCG